MPQGAEPAGHATHGAAPVACASRSRHKGDADGDGNIRRGGDSSRRTQPGGGAWRRPESKVLPWEEALPDDCDHAGIY